MVRTIFQRVHYVQATVQTKVLKGIVVCYPASITFGVHHGAVNIEYQGRGQHS